MKRRNFIAGLFAAPVAAKFAPALAKAVPVEAAPIPQTFWEMPAIERIALMSPSDAHMLTDHIIRLEAERCFRAAVPGSSHIPPDQFSKRYGHRINALADAALAATQPEDRALSIDAYTAKIIAPLLAPSPRVRAQQEAAAR